MRNIEGFWELVLGSNPVLPANQSPRAQSLPMPCEKGPLSAGLSRLNWAGEPGREQRVRHLPHHFSVGGFRGQYCPAVPARTPAPPSGLGVAVDRRAALAEPRDAGAVAYGPGLPQARPGDRQCWTTEMPARISIWRRLIANGISREKGMSDQSSYLWACHPIGRLIVRISLWAVGLAGRLPRTMLRRDRLGVAAVGKAGHEASDFLRLGRPWSRLSGPPSGASLHLLR